MDKTSINCHPELDSGPQASIHKILNKLPDDGSTIQPGDNQRFISVCIIGKPNSGKSTLLNQILGQKISIVTPKVQTTRSVINGITTVGNTQIIFFDTPGIFEPKKKLEHAMVKCAWSALHNADIILMLVDLTAKTLDDGIIQILERIKKNNLSPVFLLNKTDLVRNDDEFKKEVLEYLAGYTDTPIVFEISAKTGDGVKKLLNYICNKAPKFPWPYAEDALTTIPMRFLASEITREQLFLQLHEELPYNLTVYTEKWEERPDKSIRIDQTVLVSKDSHKSMILGKNGNKIKEISVQSRLEIEKTLDLKVHLFLFVKVRKEWMNNAELLQ
jgi:GTPase